MTSDLCCLLTLAANGITTPRWQLHANGHRLAHESTFGTKGQS